MIPTIGLLIAAYAIARLIQVPIEHTSFTPRTKALLLFGVSLVGIAVVVLCTVSLVDTGLDMSDLRFR